MEEEPMSDPGPSRPDVCSIRATNEQAEFAEAARGVLGADGYLLTDGDHPLPGRDRRVPYRRLRHVLNAALASIPHGFRYPIRQLGTAGAWLVAGNCGQGTGAGR
jgi:hypothetical protein